jgi:hypothetical protein
MAHPVVGYEPVTQVEERAATGRGPEQVGVAGAGDGGGERSSELSGEASARPRLVKARRRRRLPESGYGVTRPRCPGEERVAWVAGRHLRGRKSKRLAEKSASSRIP